MTVQELLHSIGATYKEPTLPSPVTDNAFRPAWNRLRSRADLGDLRFHDLRHEAITGSLKWGCLSNAAWLINYLD